MDNFIFSLDGYKKLIVYERAFELRKLTVEITKKFPKGEFRLIGQMRNCARSVKQNIVEGYRRATINQFLRFLSISCGSLAELSEDFEDAFDDGLITEEDYEKAKELSRKTMYLIDKLMIKLRQIKNR